jgi:DNA-binding transcriptional regulator LsrR (DeoR family)
MTQQQTAARLTTIHRKLNEILQSSNLKGMVDVSNEGKTITEKEKLGEIALALFNFTVEYKKIRGIK